MHLCSRLSYTAVAILDVLASGLFIAAVISWAGLSRAFPAPRSVV
jgi:hypothetical protein